MKKHFFSHLVEISTLEIELENLDINEKERKELKKLIDESIYHSVLDAILSELSEKDKRIFLEHVASDRHDKIWDFVNKKVLFIEEKIKKAAADIKKELHEDIKKTKNS